MYFCFKLILKFVTMINILYTLFFVLGFTLLKSQNPNNIYKQIEYLSGNTRIIVSDAILVVDNDTIPYERTSSGYVIGYGIARSEYFGKKNIKIFHPDYEIIQLDSALLTEHLFVFNKNEPFYIINGVPKPLQNDFNYISVKLKDTEIYNYNKIEKRIKSICRKHKLDVAIDFYQDIKALESEYGENASIWTYGCLKSELVNTFWLQKKDKSNFDLNDKTYLKIRTNKYVEWLSLPQEYQTNILNGILLSFKADVPEKFIVNLIKKYNLSMVSRTDFTSYIEYEFKVNSLIPSNQLLIKLMKENIVEKARPKILIYETCD